MHRIAMGAAAIVLLAIASMTQPGSAAQASDGARADEAREVALLVPRRIRLIIRYHKPREA